MRSWLLVVALSVLATSMSPWGPTTASAQYFRYGKNKVHYAERDWFYLRTEHFDVYYYQEGKELARFAARAAEDAYTEVARLFDYEPSEAIPLLVYTSHNAFAVTNAVELPTYADGIGGVTELFKNRIAVPFTGDYADFRHVIHHELVHAVINDIYYGGSVQNLVANNIQTRIPLWFNEGLAEYSAAGGWDSESDMYVREAVIEDNLTEIDRLNGFFAYRGGQGVWDYIASRYGEESIAHILQRLRLSRSVEASFDHVLGLSIAEVSEGWHRALREIHFPEIAARESVGEIGRSVVTRRDGYYNTSPALSPGGDRVAFITTRNGLFDVYVANTMTGRIEKRLVRGQTSPAFESLRILSPSLAWGPEGQRLAVVAKHGETDGIALIDIASGESEHIRVEGTEQINSIAWHPHGARLAVSATAGPQSDIFEVDVETGRTTNLTADPFSDHEPAWSPDGEFLVFQSDRGDQIDVGQSADMIEHDFSVRSLYKLVPGSTRAERLTDPGRWSDRRPQFGTDADQLLFISDRNGIANLFHLSLSDGSVGPVTDLTMGLMQFAVSADGRTAALVSLLEGTPSIFVLRSPFRRPAILSPRPNIWAQRADPQPLRVSPALSLAGSTQRTDNPYIRGVLDQRQAARRLAAGFGPAPPAEPNATSGGVSWEGADTRPSGDFSRYTFTQAFAAGARDSSLVGEPFDWTFEPTRESRAIVDEMGNYEPRAYKLDFSPDLVNGAAGYDALYGVQGVTQMMFSDMLGNHRIIVGTNLLLDLRNSDYILSYEYRPNRVDWTTSGFHISRLLADFGENTPVYYRYRQFGVSVSASYPLSKFHRVDAELSLIGINQADITNAAVPAVLRSMVVPKVTFTRDVTTPGFLYPISGSRLAVSLSTSPLGVGARSARFASILGDARAYRSLARGAYVFAMRFSGAASFGPERQFFYSSGVQNWINHSFDTQNGLPIENAEDFLLATPVLPLRGAHINARNGSYFGLLNAEFRFPLVAALLPGPFPFIPLQRIQGQVFTDAGALWGGEARAGLSGSAGDRGLSLTRVVDGRRTFDDLLVSAGFGLRVIFLGYPVRFDWAWPHDGQRFGKKQTYISLGLDF